MRILCLDIGNTHTHYGLLENRAVLADGQLKTGDLADPAEGLPAVFEKLRAAPGFGIAYPKPGEIGQDRLANCLGAQARFGAPAVIIDMGTAVTFDILTHR